VISTARCNVEALREDHAGGKPARAVDVTARPELLTAPADGWLVCARCAGLVAHARDRIEMAGAHAHSFINPEGAIFRVGCFAAAPGALAWGEPSHHWTWFVGFEWQAAGCRGCAAHLGWAYAAEAVRFVALILDRLVEVPATGPAAP